MPLNELWEGERDRELPLSFEVSGLVISVSKASLDALARRWEALGKCALVSLVDISEIQR
jgi:hypothetical protein